MLVQWTQALWRRISFIRSIGLSPDTTARRAYAKYAGILLVLAVLALLIDVPVSHYFRLHPLQGDLWRLTMMGEIFGFALSAAIIILTAGILDSRRWRILPRLILFTFGAGIGADVLKLLVARVRPRAQDWGGDVASSFVGWLPLLHRQSTYALQSFPSGHTATAVGLMIGLTTLYPRGRWLFAVFAMMTALQRITSCNHFVSDTLIGAALAFLLAAACEPFFAKREVNSLH